MAVSNGGQEVGPVGAWRASGSHDTLRLRSECILTQEFTEIRDETYIGGHVWSAVYRHRLRYDPITSRFPSEADSLSEGDARISEGAI